MPAVLSYDTLQPTTNDNKWTLLAKILIATLEGGGGGVTAPAVFISSMVGTVYDTARATAPDGFLLCFGQSLLRSAYPALFTAIGTTYGAADGTHFSLPDCRGRVVAGQDDMGGTSANRLTNTGGVTIEGDTLGAVGGSEVTVGTDSPLTAAEGEDVTIPALTSTIQPTIILNKMIFAGV